MSNGLLYGTAVLIWGSTWLAIHFQLGEVAPEWSVAYRFTLAAALLMAYCLQRGWSLRFSLRDHGFLALLGLFLFSLNYLTLYLATAYMTSGLVAVVHSTIIIMNIVNGALWLGAPVRPRVVAGAALGLVGIVLVFGAEWGELEPDAAWVGLGWALLGTLCASLGNMVAVRNQRRGLPVIQGNAVGMAYGALFMFAVAAMTGRPPTFDWSPAYLVSLVYLAVFGSVIAFGCYLTLLGRIGADRAAYATVLFPVVALTLSWLFEDYRWTSTTLAGLGLVVLGNVLVLARLPMVVRRRPVSCPEPGR